MRTFPILIALLAILISGCTTCELKTFYKPDLGKSASLENFDAGHIDWKLSKGAHITFAICADKEKTSICLSVFADEKSIIQFNAQDIFISSGDSTVEEKIKIKSFKYSIFCSIADGIKSCSSSETPPTTPSPIKIETTPIGISTYEFEANQAFLGAKDTLEQGAYFGYRLSGQRHYFANITEFKAFPKKLTILMPPVRVNGIEHKIDPIIFTLVEESVCRVLPLQ